MLFRSHEGFQRLENNTAGNTSGSDGKEKSAYLEPLTKEQQKANKENMLAREQDLIFVTPMLEGFALKNKVWREYFLALLPPSGCKALCADNERSELLRR